MSFLSLSELASEMDFVLNDAEALVGYELGRKYSVSYYVGSNFFFEVSRGGPDTETIHIPYNRLASWTEFCSGNRAYDVHTGRAEYEKWLLDNPEKIQT